MRLSLVIALAGFVFLTGQQDFEEWMKNEQQKYQQYVDQFDADFADFLDKDWQDYQSFEGLTRDNTPKPRAAPVAENKPAPLLPGPDVRIKEPLAEFPEPPADREPELTAPGAAENGVSVNYFGLTLELDSGSESHLSLERPIDNHSISDFWLGLAKLNLDGLLNQLRTLRGKLELNDWGYGYLIRETAAQISGGATAEAQLLSWYLLVKSGFDVKVGYQDETVMLLIPATQVIFEVPYFEIEGRRYYANVFDKNAPALLKLKTYSGNYPQAERMIAIELSTSPALGRRFARREYPFTYRSVEYAPVLEYNADLLDFFNAYPQTELAVYFSATPSPAARRSFYESFTPLVDGKSQAMALDLILRFVQTAFDYETDGDQFGYEKPLFPDETLYYPSCDCEDRAVLFALLTGELLGLETVGLRYPGHVAVGVKLDTSVEGDHIKVDGQNFLVCDPTYINAGIGMSMPQFKAVPPEIIRF